MPIQFQCPACRAAYTVGDDFAGRKANCQRCGQRLQVPSPRSHTVLGEVVADAKQPPVAPSSPNVVAPSEPERIPLPIGEGNARHRQLQLFVLIVGGGFVFLLGGILLLVFALGSAEKKPTEVMKTQPKPTRSSEPPKGLKQEPPRPVIPEPRANDDPPPTKRTPLRGEEVYQHLVQSSVFIIQPNGMGSGFVVDVGERLLITNAHVVGNAARTLVLFPRYNKAGELLTDPKDYERRHAIEGRVVERDVRRDLAVIQVPHIPESTKAVTLATKPAQTGATVYSVGGSGAENNLLWRLTKGTVRGRSERRVDSPHGEVACIVLETDAPVNPGDSGGPVMNEYGELVAVVSHFLRLQRQVSGNIDLMEVQRLMRSRPRE